MPSLTDPELLALYVEALKEWNCDGYIEWKPRPRDWLRENLGNFSAESRRAIDVRAHAGRRGDRPTEGDS